MCCLCFVLSIFSVFLNLLISQCAIQGILTTTNFPKLTLLDATFSGPQYQIEDFKNDSLNSFKLPIVFTSVSFTCNSTYPTEWVFDCPKYSSENIRILKSREEKGGIFYFTSILTITKYNTPSKVDSEKLDWNNFTCRSIERDHHSINSSVIGLEGCPRSDMFCIEILNGYTPVDNCVTMLHSPNLNETSLDKMPSGRNNCQSGLTLVVDLDTASYQCKYPEHIIINNNTFVTPETFYCDDIDYCASLSQRSKDQEHCIRFGGGNSSKSSYFFDRRPLVIRCSLQNQVISVPIYVAPRGNGNKNVLYPSLTEALNMSTILKVHPTSTRNATTFWEGEETEFKCIATLSLFSSGFDWILRKKLSKKNSNSSQIEERVGSSTEKNFERHEYITLIKVTLTTDMSEIICKGPIINSMDWKTASYKIRVKSPIGPRIFSDQRNGTDAIVFYCNATGSPPPSLTWLLNSNAIPNNTAWHVFTETDGVNKTFSHLIVSKEELNKLQTASVVCLARNVKETAQYEFNFKKDDVSSAIILGLVIGIGLILCVMGAVLFFMFKWLKRNGMNRELTHDEIAEFHQGVKTNDQFSGAMLMPYDTNYEIPRGAIMIEETVLGAGQFGIVVKGKLNGTVVAVKTVRPRTESAYFKALLSELKILQYVGNHPHIVNLVGACTGNIRKMEVLLILDYCSNGNMVKFLRSSRPTYIDSLHSNDDAEVIPLYQNSCMRMLTTRDLIRMACEIAEAMDFIAQKNILHGDLAARNVLVTDNKTAKVCDFGLAKQLFEYSVYVQRLECPLPLRWMAIERHFDPCASLQDMEFSIQSDVWSFGVAMWEIFTLAELPYPGVNWSFESWKLLRDGYRLEQPQYSNTFLYGLMMTCWHSDPKQRPTFKDLAKSLRDELHDLR